jgi:hypothetical protein
VRLEGLGQLKNPMTSSGIETATFRFVALGLNQLRYHVPLKTKSNIFLMAMQRYSSLSDDGVRSKMFQTQYSLVDSDPGCDAVVIF